MVDSDNRRQYARSYFHLKIKKNRMRLINFHASGWSMWRPQAVLFTLNIILKPIIYCYKINMKTMACLSTVNLREKLANSYKLTFTETLVISNPARVRDRM